MVHAFYRIYIFNVGMEGEKCVCLLGMAAFFNKKEKGCFQMKAAFELSGSPGGT